jgi:hypothetical protein
MVLGKKSAKLSNIEVSTGSVECCKEVEVVQRWSDMSREYILTRGE